MTKWLAINVVLSGPAELNRKPDHGLSPISWLANCFEDEEEEVGFDLGGDSYVEKEGRFTYEFQIEAKPGARKRKGTFLDKSLGSLLEVVADWREDVSVEFLKALSVDTKVVFHAIARGAEKEGSITDAPDYAQWQRLAEQCKTSLTELLQAN